MKLTTTRAKQFKPKPDEKNLGFGTKFTDYMFNMDYSTGAMDGTIHGSNPMRRSAWTPPRWCSTTAKEFSKA